MSVRRSTGGAGASPSASSRARMNRSSAPRGHASSATAGGSAASTGCHAQCSRRRFSRSNGSDGSGVPAATVAASGHGAPISTHAIRLSTCAGARAPVGGINTGRPCTRCTRGLACGSPGTTAGPLSPPASSPSRLSSRSPPNGVSNAAPWHWKHCSASSGRISVSKNSTCSGPGPAGWAPAWTPATRATVTPRSTALILKLIVPRTLAPGRPRRKRRTGLIGSTGTGPISRAARHGVTGGAVARKLYSP